MRHFSRRSEVPTFTALVGKVQSDFVSSDLGTFNISS